MVVVLSACIPVANISARISESGVLEFGVCDDYELDSIKVSVLDKESHDALTVWQVDGRIQIEDGSIVSLGQPPSGSEEVITLVDFDLANTYVDFILIAHQDGQIVSSYGHFDGADIVEDSWLTNWGNHRDTPC